MVPITAENVKVLQDEDTINECLTFVKNENGKPEAIAGKHDDLVMALAIAHEIRVQQSSDISAAETGTAWSADMWEDYNNASQTEREYLLRRWGRPKGDRRE